jgi:hypothetical protein
LFILAASLIVVAASGKWIEVRQAPDNRCITDALSEKVTIVYEVSDPVQVDDVRVQRGNIVEPVWRPIVGERFASIGTRVLVLSKIESKPLAI